MTWDSVGVLGDALVEVTLSTLYSTGPIINGGGSASAVTALCKTAASTGRVTLPAEMVGQIGAVPSFPSATSVVVTLVPREPVLLSVPVVQGGVMAGTLGYRLSDFLAVQFSR